MSDEQMSPEESSLKLWCVGTVTKDKVRGDFLLQVNPIEHLSMQSGEMGDNQQEYTEKIGDSFGGSSSQALKGEKTITAEWSPMGDNHLWTAPMMTAGESVRLYRFADESKVYWTSVWSAPKIRRKDWIVFGAANQPAFGQPVDLNSMYYLEFDTDQDKLIRLRTTNSDGETYQYELLLDAGRNTATLHDDIGNAATIDSPNNNVSLVDVSGGMYETRDGHPKITGPKGVLIEAPQIVLDGDVVMTKTALIQGAATFQSGIGVSGGSGGATMVINGDIEISQTLTVQGAVVFNSTLLVMGFATLQGGHGPPD